MMRGEEEISGWDRHVGLSIGLASITAVGRRRTLLGARPGRTYRWNAEDEGASGPELLDRALGALAASARPGTTIHVALQWPLAQVKRLVLPRLPRPELRRLVGQSAGRFFAVRGAAAGDAVLLRGRGRTGRATLAAASQAEFLADLESAVLQHGFEIGSVSPAPIAASVGAGVLAPRVRRGAATLVWATSSGAELLVLRGGRLQVARSVPADPAVVDPQAIAAALDEVDQRFGLAAGRVHLCGGAFPECAEEETPWIRHPTLESHGYDELSAFGAALLPQDLPRFQPEDRWDAWERKGRRRVHLMSAGAAAMALFAAGFHLIDLRGELAAVERQRETLRPALEDAREARAAVTAVENRVLAFEAAEAGAVSWTAVIAAIADALPADAHLSGLRTEGGLLRLEGRARSAAEAVAALERSPLLRDVKIVSALQREETPDGVFERISMTAAIAMPGSSGGETD